MALTATYQTTLDTIKTSARALATATATYKKSLSAGFASAHSIYTSAAVVASSVTVNLATGLLDAIGDPVTLGTLDFIRIRNTGLATGSSALTVLGGASAIPFLTSATAQITLNPQHWIDFSTSTGGLSLASANRVTINGSACPWELVVIGRNA